MRIRTKMGLSFFLIGGAFLALLIIFIYLGNSIETLRHERTKIDTIQILWSETTARLYRVIIDRQPESARNEWDRLASNLDTRLTLFLSSQISTHSLVEGDPHYANLEALNRAWKAVQEEFLKIDLLFDAGQRSTGPLLQLNGTHAATGSGDDPELEQLCDAVINFAPFRDLFGSTLLNTIQYVDDEIAARTRRVDRLMVVLFALTILFSVLLAALFAGRIARRIEAVESAVAAVSRGDFSTRLALTTQDEFGRLSNNFNSLIQELKNRVGLGFRAMYRLNHALGGDVGQEQVRTTVTAAAAEITAADAAALLIWKEGAAGREGEHDAYFQGPFPVQMLSLTGETRLPVRLAAGEHPVLGPDDGPFSSLAAHPLLHGDRRIGAIIAIRKEGSAPFNDLDLFHLEHFAEFGALTLENSLQQGQLEIKQRLEREMELAASIQKRLIPEKVPQFPHIRVSFHSRPAGLVGGDYFDVLRLPRNRIGLIVCDVSGKGLPASLVMVMIRTILHIIGPAAKDAGTIVRYLNAGLTGSVEPGIFATLSLLIIDRESGKTEYVNAGHLPALLLRAGETEPSPLDSDGLPIGLEPKAAYSPVSLTLSTGDTILLYSDGVSEAHGKHGGMYSRERLAAVFARSHGMDTENIKRSILSDVGDFTGATEQSDDQTLVVVKAV